MKPAPMPAEDALAYLAHWGDTLQLHGRTLFVVELPSNPAGEAVLDAVIAAAGAAEDREDDDPAGGNVEDEGEYDRCDDERSLVTPTGSGYIPGFHWPL